MSGYFFHVTCPRCGSELRHVTSGAPGGATAAVAACDQCRFDWLIGVAIRVANDRSHLPPVADGRPRPGHQAHRRRHEIPCAPPTPVEDDDEYGPLTWGWAGENHEGALS